MKYNEAAFIGQKRAKEAQMKLFDYTGFAMLTYTIRKEEKDVGFMPVGEGLFVAKLIYENKMIIYLTDEDGFAKAQSKPLKVDEGDKIYNKIIEDGLKEYAGQVKTI
jgi:hypothetical protein